jgi:DNA-binding MurR/RpiR family transcriptional regulator
VTHKCIGRGILNRIICHKLHHQMSEMLQQLHREDVFVLADFERAKNEIIIANFKKVCKVK